VTALTKPFSKFSTCFLDAAFQSYLGVKTRAANADSFLLKEIIQKPTFTIAWFRINLESGTQQPPIIQLQP